MKSTNYVGLKNVGLKKSVLLSIIIMCLVVVTILFFVKSGLALSILSPQETTYNTSDIYVSYITTYSNSTFCSIKTDGGLWINSSLCKSIFITAHEGYNVVLVDDGYEKKSVGYYLVAQINNSNNTIQITQNNDTSSLNLDLGGNNNNSNLTFVEQDDIDPLSLLPQEIQDEIIQGEQITNDELVLQNKFTSRSPSTGTITVEHSQYDYPAGVSFKALVKIHNTGQDSAVVISPAALYADILQITRIDIQPQTKTITKPIYSSTIQDVCTIDGCVKKEVKKIIRTERENKIEKIGIKKPLLKVEGFDSRSENIRNSKDRAPKTAKSITAKDTIYPGEDAYYEITFRASGNGNDEFYIQALSNSMAIGLDPFISSNWTHMRNITLQETYNITRNNQLVYLNLTNFNDDNLRNCSEEIRVSNSSLDDVAVRIIDDGGNLTTGKYCTITFGASVVALQNTTYYIYWENVNATAPAAAIDVNELYNLTWTPSAVYFNTTDYGTAADNTDYMAPTIVDYDCDGNLDLVYGLDDGGVYLRRNLGNNVVPNWSATTTVLATIGANSGISFGLLFGGDNLLDMVVGENTGNLNYYENTGTCASPIWTARTFSNSTADFGTWSSPTVYDYNGDGLTDVLIGVSTGLWNSTRNYNTTTLPAFIIDGITEPTTDVGTNNFPSEADLNFDGVIDVVSGNSVGNVRLFQNNGTITSPSWINWGLLRYNVSGGSIDVGNNAHPSLYDINGDGWIDMVLGEAIGTIRSSLGAGGLGDYLINAPLNYTLGEQNIRPVVNSFSITPSPAYKNGTLNCTINISDVESDTVLVNFSWRRNGTAQPLLNSSVVCQNNTLCLAGVIINSSQFNNTDTWTCSAFAIDGGWRVSYDTNVSILNYPTDFTFFNIPAPIVLNAGTTKLINFNLSILDYDGNTTINLRNMSIYLNNTAPGVIDNNVSHYTNTTCRLLSVSPLMKNYTCSFLLNYYAVNGTWIANATVNDTWSIITDIINFSIDPLYALNLSVKNITFGNLAAGDISSNISIITYNLGNQKINISSYSYGRNVGDNNGFTCAFGNLTPDVIHYSNYVGHNFTQKSNLSGSSSLLNLSVTTQMNSTLTSNISYWQVGVPVLTPLLGLCNGTIVFQAEAG